MAGIGEGGTDNIVIVVSCHKKCKKCIFEVPMVLRKHNSDAYTPHVVSIGPYHHQGEGSRDEGKEKAFKPMERVKKSYLNEILSRMNMTSEELTEKFTEPSDRKQGGGFEARARELYAEPLDHITSKDLVEMMIVDGCFLVQLFRKFNHQELRALDDPAFNMDGMINHLCRDILLLENQLPWFVIHCLYTLTLDIYPDEASLSTLILKAFSILPSLKQSCSSYNKHLRRNKFRCDADYLHILDLLRASIVIPLMAIDERKARKESLSNRGEDHQRHQVTIEKEEDRSVYPVFDPDLHQIRTATDLSKAEIKFKSVIRQSIIDIRFVKGGRFKNGTLQIPKLNGGRSSETLFRNLIAIEQCYRGYSNKITSYAILMDNLISSKEDLELLCKEKVIGNWINDEGGCKFFSNLCKDITYREFYYDRFCKKVNDHYAHYCHLGLYKRMLKEYFPKLVYVFVGVVLLQVIPTILQTIYTMKQYYDPPK